MGTRAIVLMGVAFHNCNGVGTRDKKSYAAQWLAYALPYRRFDIAGARLGADVDRYSFTVVDSHHLLLADLTGALQYAFLNSHFQSGLRNLLDHAILAHVDLNKKLGIGGGYSKLDEIPFDFTRRRLSVVVAREDGKHILICKGAVEEVFAVCTRYTVDGETGRLDESHFAAAKTETVASNSDGFRVVAVAFREMDPSKTAYSVADEADLTLLGNIAFLDPPKESAREAIAALARRGVSRQQDRGNDRR